MEPIKLSIAFGPSSKKTIQIVPNPCKLETLKSGFGYDSQVTVLNLDCLVDSNRLISFNLDKTDCSAQSIEKMTHLLNIDLVKRSIFDVIEAYLKGN
jgi:hypothetical protein